MIEIREKRSENAKRAMEDQLKHTTLNQNDYLAVKERNKIAQIKALKRGLKCGEV